MGLQHNNIILPAIKTLITKEEREFFQQNSETVKTIKELEIISLQEVNGNNVGIDIIELKRQTSNLQHQSRLNQDTMLVLFIIVFVVTILALILVICRNKIFKCIEKQIVRWKKPRPARTLTQGRLVSGEIIRDKKTSKKKQKKTTSEIEEIEEEEEEEEKVQILDPKTEDEAVVMYAKHSNLT